MSTSHVNRDIENNDALQRAPKERIKWMTPWKRGPVSNLSSLATMLKDSKNGDSALSILDQAGQCLFLCLRKQKDYYVVQVPCIRPAPTRQIISRHLRWLPDDKVFEFTGDVDYAPLTSAQKAVESDAAIWHRIRETYFDDKGKWRKWLPFYGPTLVREIEFQFVGVIDQDTRYRVFGVTPVDLHEVEERADCVIASAPDEADYDYGNECCGDRHSTKCAASKDPLLTCIMDLVEEAKHRKRRLGMLSQLIDCANHPWMANGLETLKGMAQDSCIYELEKIIIPQHDRPYRRTDTMRGIELVMGWQKDRLIPKSQLYICWLYFSLALTWLCVIVWGGRSNDWSTAMAFGQLLAACISLVFLYAKTDT